MQKKSEATTSANAGVPAHCAACAPDMKNGEATSAATATSRVRMFASLLLDCGMMILVDRPRSTRGGRGYRPPVRGGTGQRQRAAIRIHEPSLTDQRISETVQERGHLTPRPKFAGR
ncbi:MAG TPA: hypothetical protein VNE58_15070 [Casimicrobiaceae bacterium]|nr:hypothetical protein [Casimicrobiaceae bacterium]